VPKCHVTFYVYFFFLLLYPRVKLGVDLYIIFDHPSSCAVTKYPNHFNSLHILFFFSIHVFPFHLIISTRVRSQIQQ
jgi:hypothetical protein